MDINLTALFLACKQFALNNKKGSIVNFSSTYGVVSPRLDLYKEGHKDIGYSVSKAGVIMLTKQLATHLAPNIRVNCIVPGGVENNQEDSFINSYEEQCPMGRMMKKTEIAPLVEFLISKKSSYCTGGIFTIDGGWTAW
jgi:NAD(P)-dependent dehydrogenase (short-subunit alcohol dehydrogenase family)